MSNLGSSFGTAIAGTILVAGLTKGAYAAAMITLAVFGLGGLAAAAFLPRETGSNTGHTLRGRGGRKTVGTVNTYAAKTAYRQVVFTRTLGTTIKTHKVQLRILSGSAPGRSTVALDAVMVAR
ncbi:hypothetical protein [Streptomyces mirabilis]|uniref:hypothetical protein n=1 Tax=Streptomyces mirabilis TaxID=68239 RepID=UPI0036E19BAE